MYVAMYMYDCGYQWISGTHPVFVGTCKLQWRFVRRSKKPAGPLQRSTDLISSSSPATCFQGPSIHGIAAERKKEGRCTLSLLVELLASQSAASVANLRSEG